MPSLRPAWAVARLTSLWGVCLRRNLLWSVALLSLEKTACRCYSKKRVDRERCGILGLVVQAC